MIKKLVAGIVAACILSTGIIALADTLQENRKDLPAFARSAKPSLERTEENLKPVFERLRAYLAERLKKKAGELGIGTEGLSGKEILEKIRETVAEQNKADVSERLKRRAEKLGIDVEGLSDEEIMEKVAQALKEKVRIRNEDGASSGELRRKLSAVTEQRREKLLEAMQKKAEELGIDTAGLTPKEILIRIRKAIIEKNDQDLPEKLKEWRVVRPREKLEGKIDAFRERLQGKLKDRLMKKAEEFDIDNGCRIAEDRLKVYNVICPVFLWKN